MEERTIVRLTCGCLFVKEVQSFVSGKIRCMTHKKLVNFVEIGKFLIHYGNAIDWRSYTLCRNLGELKTFCQLNGRGDATYFFNSLGYKTEDIIGRWFCIEEKKLVFKN